MKTYKYELLIEDRQRIYVGDKDVRPLSVGEQNGKMVMWAWVREGLFTEEYNNYVTVDIVGTGNPYNGDMAIENFVGTVIMSYGLVWHVYARLDIRRFL